MKRLLLVLAAIVELAIVPHGAIAQDNSGCYMKNSSGQVFDLSALCSNSNAIKAPSQSVSPGVFQAAIKRREHGTPVIDVVFSTKNSTRTYEMIVDTGASITAITPEMAESLGVIPVAVTRVSTPSDRNVQVPLGYINSIEVNGAAVTDLLVGITPALSTGLLGHDFFGRYEVTVKQNVVEFRIPQ